MEAVLGYTKMESIEPKDDTLLALANCIKSWSSRQAKEEKRTVHVFCNFGEFWLKGPAGYALSLPTDVANNAMTTFG